MNRALDELRKQQFEDPQPVRFLFDTPLMGFAWFFLRIFLGWQWLTAGWRKVYGDSSIGWVRDGEVNGRFVNAGDTILAFWTRAVAIPQTGTPPIKYDWYREFLQYMIDQRWNGWMTYVIAYGEVIVGLLLILGAFTALAAAWGATMNLSFLLAGTVSSNPVLLVVAILLILAWKTAGYVGLDRWLLPALGTPWQPGQLFAAPTGERRPAAAHRAAAAGATLAVWAGVAGVVLFIAAKGDVYWNLVLGYVLAAAVVLVAWVATDVVLGRLGLEPPFRPGLRPAGRVRG